MKKFLAEILIDPVSSEPLQFDETKNILHTSDNGYAYTNEGDVPVFLTNGSSPVTSLLHQQVKTDFNYPVHYQKDAEVIDYFKKEENITTRNEIHRLHQVIINAVPANARLMLDAGCGNAWLAKYFLQKNRQVISMDISTVNPIRALKENSDENHAALVADVFNLPLKNNSIDCIVAAEIMEHVHDPRLFTGKLIEKLKPGGKLIITTPYNEKIEYFLCVHCNLPTPKNAHLHSFNKQNIKEIISNEGVMWKAKSFANKYMIKSRLSLALSFLPFRFWKFVDRLANAVLSSPTRLIIEIIKK